MRWSKRMAAGILAAGMMLSLMTACSSDAGGGNPENDDMAQKPGIGTDAGNDSDKNKNENSGDNKDDSANAGGDASDGETAGTTISWEKSRLSKVYPIDVSQKGGTVRFDCTQEDGTIDVQFIRTASVHIGKILEYCGTSRGEQYLWQMDLKSRETQDWVLDPGGTYQVETNRPAAFGVAERIAIGPDSRKEPAPQAAWKTYQGQPYYTETIQMDVGGRPFQAAYYFEGATLQRIELTAEQYGAHAWLTNISLQISPALMDDADSILTAEEKEKIDPNSYTLRESVS